MSVSAFVDRHGGLSHRSRLLDAGFSPAGIRAAVRDGEVARIRRYWFASASAPPDLRLAAQATARLACVSAARHRGWWMPDGEHGVHLHLHPHSASPTVAATMHWTQPLAPVPRDQLVESVEDTLEHIAGCLPRSQALVLWESALRVERRSPAELRRVRWRSIAARELAAEADALSDSGLETLFVRRVRPWGVPVRQQVSIAGHDVDLLLGERLVAQLDGFAHHSSTRERTRDLAHDRELVALGYTVLRFSYVEVVHRWPTVERALRRALAQGAHLA